MSRRILGSIVDAEGLTVVDGRRRAGRPGWAGGIRFGPRPSDRTFRRDVTAAAIVILALTILAAVSTRHGSGGRDGLGGPGWPSGVGGVAQVGVVDSGRPPGSAAQPSGADGSIASPGADQGLPPGGTPGVSGPAGPTPGSTTAGPGGPTTGPGGSGGTPGPGGGTVAPPPPPPPPVNAAKRSAYSVIQAEDFDAQSGIVVQPCSDTGGGSQVSSVNDGDWLRFDRVDFTSTSPRLFRPRFASGATSNIYGLIQIRIDSLANSPIAGMGTSNTGGWQTWVVSSNQILPTTGIHTMYVTFSRYSGGTPTEQFMNVNWFQFDS